MNERFITYGRQLESKLPVFHLSLLQLSNIYENIGEKKIPTNPRLNLFLNFKTFSWQDLSFYTRKMVDTSLARKICEH